MTSVFQYPARSHHKVREPQETLTQSKLKLVESEPNRIGVLVCQILVVAAVICAWQWLPSVHGVQQHVTFVDPFYISSPSLIATTLAKMLTGSSGTPSVWEPLGRTLAAALAGTAAAIVCGTVAGLVVSNSAFLHRVLRPFIVTLNAVPRIAMIPVIVLIVRNGSLTDAITAFSVVFFLSFFNSVEGGTSMSREMISNVRLLGGSRMTVMWRVRWHYALAWSFASLPNAIAFGILGSVTAELFTGGQGVGYILTYASETANASLTFATAIVLTAVSLILIFGAEALRKPLLSWWEDQRA